MGNAVALRTAEQPRLSGRALRILKDERLAAMVAGGSDDAFATLYGRHHQAVYRYCLSLLRQEADARDALQSSMLAALSSLRASPIEGAFKPWLFRIAHNQSISIIRGRAREAPTEAPSTAAFTDDPERREQFRTLVSDLVALPDRQRGAIVMRELSGLSYTEIAAALGTSEAGGKQLVYEARSALHELRDGHEMSCELVRERISADDRRLLRGRKVRSHLRGCQPCQDFEQAIRRRRPAFAALAPPLAPLAAVAVLQEVFGGGGASGGAGGAGGAVGATGVASGGAPLAGPAALKLMAAVLLTGAAGVGAYEAGTAIFADPAVSAPATLTETDTSANQPGRPAESSHAALGASDRGGDGGAGGGAAANSRANARGPEAGAGSDTSQAGNDGSPGASGGPGDAAGPGGPGGGSGVPGGGSGGPGTPGGGPGGGAGEPPPSPPAPPGPAPPPGGGSGPAPGTPPGHGGTPPGQGGTPPGQAGGGTPPGHIGNPGHGGGRP
jgi:RNA polymerase sigma factor (sigma-70 family)